MLGKFISPLIVMHAINLKSHLKGYYIFFKRSLLGPYVIHMQKIHHTKDILRQYFQVHNTKSCHLVVCLLLPFIQHMIRMAKNLSWGIYICKNSKRVPLTNTKFRFADQNHTENAN